MKAICALLRLSGCRSCCRGQRLRRRLDDAKAALLRAATMPCRLETCTASSGGRGHRRRSCSSASQHTALASACRRIRPKPSPGTRGLLTKAVAEAMRGVGMVYLGSRRDVKEYVKGGRVVRARGRRLGICSPPLMPRHACIAMARACRWTRQRLRRVLRARALKPAILEGQRNLAQLYYCGQWRSEDRARSGAAVRIGRRTERPRLRNTTSR